MRGALCDAAYGKRALLILDDVWTRGVVDELDVVDSARGSCTLVTTRIKGLLPDAAEFELGVLPADSAVQLLLEVA